MRWTLTMLAPEASSGETNASMWPSGESARWVISCWMGMKNSSAPLVQASA